MEKDNLKYVVLSSRSTSGLTATVNEYIENGWEVQGSHQVLTKMIYNERAHTIQRYEVEYSQTLIRK
jgi:hypothetical protein